MIARSRDLEEVPGSIPGQALAFYPLFLLSLLALEAAVQFPREA